MTSDPLAEVEAIIENEAGKLQAQHDELRKTIRAIARQACIPEEKAAVAYCIFEQNIIDGAKAAGEDVDVFLGRMPSARRQLLMGMIIGALLCDQHLVFQYLGKYPDGE